MLPGMATRRAQIGGAALTTRLTEGEGQWLADHAAARDVVELDGDGYSTVMMALTASHVTSVTSSPLRSADIGRALVAYGLYGKVTPEHPTSVRAWCAAAVPRHYGLVYLDATTPHAAELLALARPLVYTGGFVLVRGFRADAMRAAAAAGGMVPFAGVDSMAVFEVRGT